MITLLDTTHVINHTAPEAGGMSVGVAIALATFALALGGILVRGGILIGEHNETRRRVDDVEKAQKTGQADAITRHELDALLGQMDEKLEAMKDRLEDAVSTMREVLKR